MLTRGLRTSLLVLALAGGAVTATAAPAAAHGLGGAQATNYQTRILDVSPRVPGIEVRVTDGGSKVEVRNSTGHDLVVPGYDGEPYLRVGPRGTFENIRSPATYLNRTLTGTTPVPDVADRDAPAKWLRKSSSTTARFHDHRSHWMGREPPLLVERNPSAEARIQRWHIDLRLQDGSQAGGRPIRVSGDLRWVPGPPLWPWMVGALALALGLVAAARTRRWGLALATGLAMLLVASVVHLAGMWIGSTASLGSQLGGSVYQLVGIAVTTTAAVVLARRGPAAAAPWAFIGALLLAITGGISDVSVLTHSQLPTGIPVWLDRLAVVVTIGAGAGVAISAALHVAPAPGRRAEVRRELRSRSRDTRARASHARSRTGWPASP